MKQTVKYMEGIAKIPENLLYEQVRSGWFGVMFKSKSRYEKVPTTKFLFYSCRDGYQEVSKTRITKSGMFFSHEENEGDRHALFLMNIEEMLKLNKRSEFRKTNLTNVLWIKLSSWWLETKTRRSFLTLMMRLAKYYDPAKPWTKNTVTEVAMCHHRGESTLPAIKRFLRGNTYCTAEKPRASWHGWVEIFEGKTQRQVCQLLLKTKPLETK